MPKDPGSDDCVRRSGMMKMPVTWKKVYRNECAE
jgi:hypothetical protein